MRLLILSSAFFFPNMHKLSYIYQLNSIKNNFVGVSVSFRKSVSATLIKFCGANWYLQSDSKKVTSNLGFFGSSPSVALNLKLSFPLGQNIRE